MTKSYSTDWTGVPMLSKKASPKLYSKARDARVVFLMKATIRNAVVSGYFKLAEGAEVKPYAGKQRIEVECLWFGRKPPSTWMNITLLSKPQFNYHYSGEVVWDIRD
jgi:hypothetical protein